MLRPGRGPGRGSGLENRKSRSERVTNSSSPYGGSSSVPPHPPPPPNHPATAPTPPPPSAAAAGGRGYYRSSSERVPAAAATRQQPPPPVASAPAPAAYGNITNTAAVRTSPPAASSTGPYQRRPSETSIASAGGGGGPYQRRPTAPPAQQYGGFGATRGSGSSRSLNYAAAGAGAASPYNSPKQASRPKFGAAAAAASHQKYHHPPPPPPVNTSSSFANRSNNNSNYSSTGGAAYSGGGGMKYAAPSAYGTGYNSAYASAPASYNNDNISNNGSAAAAEYKDKPIKQRKRSSWCSCWCCSPILLSILTALCCLAYALQMRWKQQNLLQQMDAESLEDAIRVVKMAKRESDVTERELKNLKDSYRKTLDTSNAKETELRKLQKEVEGLMAEQKDDDDDTKLKKLETRDQAWQEQVKLLQDYTRRESRRAALDKFGPGPHFVEITVALPSMVFVENQDENPNRSFVIEMAPLDVMPHAVHLFLEQVTHGLWNNAWFYINGPHVWQAGPQADEEELKHAIENGQDERSLALQPFRELQLDTLAFPEYSADYTHLPWTLGFTGRPGGPDFYINKVDNQESHGPGGQFHHDLEEFADACFAKVVHGFDTLNAMSKVPTIQEETDYQYFFEDPVNVVNMKIVDNPLEPRKEKVAKKASAASKEKSAAFEVHGQASPGKNGDGNNNLFDALKHAMDESKPAEEAITMDNEPPKRPRARKIPTSRRKKKDD